MYWSCFKSESEFRVELPLPQSELSTYAHPSLFPTPPSSAEAQNTGIYEQDAAVLQSINGDNVSGSTMVASPLDGPVQMKQHHPKLLWNEDESWYYYLTEIALRRIGNRIINTFYGDGCTSWSRVRDLLPIAVEFDTQVSAWSANLPSAMQHWERSEAIRAPTYESVPDAENAVSRELSWATDNRLLEMRSWLYQPFLHYLIHQLPPLQYQWSTVSGSATDGFISHPPTSHDFVEALTTQAPEFSSTDAGLLYHFLSSGIECNLKILDVRSLRHRHHGLWYDLRSTMTASLILLGIVKSGNEEWIPGGPEALWGYQEHNSAHDIDIGGKIGQVLVEFDFWTRESPDMERHREVLIEVTRQVQQQWVARSYRGQR
jgi:hypothetical protein